MESSTIIILTVVVVYIISGWRAWACFGMKDNIDELDNILSAPILLTFIAIVMVWRVLVSIFSFGKKG